MKNNNPDTMAQPINSCKKLINARMKTIIKLKEAGFTASEIIDLGEAGLIWVMDE